MDDHDKYALKLTHDALVEALDALEGMVYQDCPLNDASERDTGALSAYAEAVDVLEKHDRVKVLRGFGRMSVFRFNSDPVPAPPRTDDEKEGR